jgi:hypothetical protein
MAKNLSEIIKNKMGAMESMQKTLIRPDVFKMPIIKSPTQYAFEQLIEYIKDFQNKLDQNHEVGASLVSFGNSTVFHVDSVALESGGIITFFGINDKDEKLQLIQHITQLNVLLVAMKKRGEVAKRIGFEFNKKTE